MTPADLEGRAVALSTMHGKQRAFGPVLAERHGIEIIVPRGLDTDTLGTFNDEVPRPVYDRIELGQPPISTPA